VKKKGAKDKEEEKVVEAPKPVEVKQKEEERELDLNDSQDFAKAISKQVPRAFTFGPIEFADLDRAFNMEAALDMIINCLEATSSLGKS